jgi:hypothetical protein
MSQKELPKLVDCDRLWTEMVTMVYRLLRKPRVTSFPPPLPPSKSRPPTP